jgi:protein involved in temperature-dependent protein secretion
MKPIYAQTGKMAELLGVDTKFLNTNKDTTFQLGQHYFIPSGKKYCLWKISEMISWVENTTNNKLADDVFARMVG